ncbi:MAG: OmpA family protein [Alphaproteobacteria bacterium]|nr:OmpA family protein [Alphaproteobacteria bacterium]
MRIFTATAAAGLLIGLSTAAMAEVYVGAQTGLNMAADADADAAGVNRSIEHDAGWGVLGQLGVGLGQFRLEAEVGWRDNGVSDVNGLSADGNMQALSLMGNAYFDIPTSGPITPYVGAGLGVAQVTADNVRQGAAAVIDDEASGLAYQGIVGAAWKLNQNLSLKADYRYFATEDLDMNDAAGRSTEVSYDAHSIMVGFSWRFAEPPPKPVEQAKAPPPAPPKPAPQPTLRNFMVFFDWDKADITAEAREIIAQAAATAKRGGLARLELSGHADRSGAEPYNLKLSQRRAENVRAALAQAGIGPDTISVVAKGESAPLVPTPDGVREPQNRRVEIVLPQ